MTKKGDADHEWHNEKNTDLLACCGDSHRNGRRVGNYGSKIMAS